MAADQEEQGTARHRLGDRRAAASYLDVTYIVRKGETVMQVDYEGWDAGIFTREVPQEAEMTAMAKLVAEEVLGKL